MTNNQLANQLDPFHFHRGKFVKWDRVRQFVDYHKKGDDIIKLRLVIEFFTRLLKKRLGEIKYLRRTR